MGVTHVGLHVTDRCNLNCRHCLRDPALTPDDLPLSLITRVLDQARPYGIDHVALTGGEPFLHPEIVAIVDAIVDRGMTWRVVSNGSRLATLTEVLGRRALRLERLRHITLSLDGAEEATHDAIRGAGSYREVMGAVALCTAVGAKFALQMAVHARNEHEIEAHAMLGAQLGAEAVSYASPTPTGTHIDAELRLPRRAWDTIHARLDRLSQLLQIRVNAPEGYPSKQKFHVCGPWQSDSLHVNVAGQLSLCCQLSDTPSEGSLSDHVGDLRDMSLTEGHGRTLALIHELQRRRLQEIADGTLGPWDELPCNWCQKQFGKPHWTAEGVGGAAADRDRWRGAWAGGATGRAEASRIRLPIAK